MALWQNVKVCRRMAVEPPEGPSPVRLPSNRVQSWGMWRSGGGAGWQEVVCRWCSGQRSEKRRFCTAVQGGMPRLLAEVQRFGRWGQVTSAVRLCAQARSGPAPVNEGGGESTQTPWGNSEKGATVLRDSALRREVSCRQWGSILLDVVVHKIMARNGNRTQFVLHCSLPLPLHKQEASKGCMFSWARGRRGQ